jgi:hypothetical protein
MLALALVLGLASSAAAPAPAGEPGDTGDVRLEHFVLELHGAEADAPVREVGLVCMRRRKIAGREDGMQLECECLFRRDAAEGDSEHVLHVERLTNGGPRLVWREWGPGRARCLTADWAADGGALHMVESCRGGMPRETLSAGEGAVMPLYLLELARNGGATAGKYRRLDPLSRALETIELRVSHRVDAGTELRVVDWLRDDGSLAGHFEFRGNELVSFRWQEGDLVARRITAQQYAERTTRPSASAAPAAFERRP